MRIAGLRRSGRDKGLIKLLKNRAPAGDVSGMTPDDRNALVILKRWAQNTAFLKADVTICLIADS